MNREPPFPQYVLNLISYGWIENLPGCIITGWHNFAITPFPLSYQRDRSRILRVGNLCKNGAMNNLKPSLCSCALIPQPLSKLWRNISVFFETSFSLSVVHCKNFSRHIRLALPKFLLAKLCTCLKYTFSLFGTIFFAFLHISVHANGKTRCGSVTSISPHFRSQQPLNRFELIFGGTVPYDYGTLMFLVLF